MTTNTIVSLRLEKSLGNPTCFYKTCAFLSAIGEMSTRRYTIDVLE